MPALGHHHNGINPFFCFQMEFSVWLLLLNPCLLPPMPAGTMEQSPAPLPSWPAAFRRLGRRGWRVILPAPGMGLFLSQPGTLPLRSFRQMLKSPSVPGRKTDLSSPFCPSCWQVELLHHWLPAWVRGATRLEPPRPGRDLVTHLPALMRQHRLLLAFGPHSYFTGSHSAPRSWRGRALGGLRGESPTHGHRGSSHGPFVFSSSPAGLDFAGPNELGMLHGCAWGPKAHPHLSCHPSAGGGADSTLGSPGVPRGCS